MTHCEADGNLSAAEIAKALGPARRGLGITARQISLRSHSVAVAIVVSSPIIGRMPRMPITGTLLTTEEAADELHIIPATLCIYVRRGLIRPERKVGSTFVFSEREVERFKHERRKPGNPAFIRKK